MNSKKLRQKWLKKLRGAYCQGSWIKNLSINRKTLQVSLHKSTVGYVNKCRTLQWLIKIILIMPRVLQTIILCRLQKIRSQGVAQYMTVPHRCIKILSMLHLKILLLVILMVDRILLWNLIRRKKKRRKRKKSSRYLSYLTTSKVLKILN
jgi:hypothetical protein